MAITVESIGLFAGVGMLDAGFALACEYLGWAHRCVGYVERDAYAASILMARMEEAALECAPVFCGDIQDVDGCDFGACENLWLVGGFPCQDISVAGKGAGIIEGKRSGLWREYARLIEESECAGVFIENVAALVHRGLDTVLADLARLGFDAEWGSFRASDVGAPHRRERVFIVAYRQGHRDGRVHPRSKPEGAGTPEPDRCGAGGGLADSTVGGFGIGGQSPGLDGLADGCGQEVPATRVPEAAEARNNERVLEATGRIRDGARDCAGNDPMADAEHTIGRAEHEKQSEAHGRDGLGRSRASLANPAGGSERVGLGQQAASGTGAEPGPEGLCEGLGDSGGERLQERGSDRCLQQKAMEPQAGEVSRSTNRPSANGAAKRRSRRDSADRDRFARDAGLSSSTANRNGCGETFPPGPSDRDAWAAIIARHPELAPAVEPGVRVLADGLAVVVDEPRADQLRCTGNGVVALQAAYAFVALAERTGLA